MSKASKRVNLVYEWQGECVLAKETNNYGTGSSDTES